MFLRTLISLLILFHFSFSAGAVDSKNRVEELFIWKISDELKLSVPEERSFSKLIKTLNERRSQVNEDLQAILRQLSDSKTTKDKEKLLTEQDVESLVFSLLEEDQKKLLLRDKEFDFHFIADCVSIGFRGG